MSNISVSTKWTAETSYHFPYQRRVWKSLFFLWSAACLFTYQRTKSHPISVSLIPKTADPQKNLFNSLLFCEKEEQSVMTPYGSPIFDEIYFESEWARLENAPFSEKKLYTFIEEVSSSSNHRSYFGKIINKLLDEDEESWLSCQTCKAFMAEAPHLFRSYALEKLTLLLKTHRGQFESLASMFEFYELLPLHKAYILMNRLIEIGKEQYQNLFEKYFLLCSEEERKILLQSVPKKSIDIIKPYLKNDEISLFAHALTPEKSDAEILQENPLIYLYKGLLNDTQIESIIKRVKPDSFKDAHSVDSNGRTTFSRVAKITSLAGFSEIEEMIFPIFEAKLKVNREDVEDLDLVYYPVNRGRFSDHYDAFDPILMEKKCLVQRRATAIFYLNTVLKGGETVFQSVFVRPEKGSLLFFENIDTNGKPVNEHAGHQTMDPEGKWIIVAHVLKSYEDQTEKEKHCPRQRHVFVKKVDFSI